MAIYAAEAGHARYGILRAVVRDHSDTSTDLESDIWIDSDGRVGDNSGFVNPNTPGSGGWMDTGPQNPKGLDDNEWHHVVVTTLVEGGKGYRLYLDGLLKAELKMGVMRTTDPNSEDSSSSSSAEQTGVGGAGTVSNASNYAKVNTIAVLRWLLVYSSVQTVLLLKATVPQYGKSAGTGAAIHCCCIINVATVVHPALLCHCPQGICLLVACLQEVLIVFVPGADQVHLQFNLTL